MTWWVETFLNTEQEGYSLWVLCKTNYADHLFLSWSYHHPAREPILVVVRGSHKQCGYKYIWDTPNIVEQNTPGDTLVHQFHLTGLKAPSHIWYYLWAPDGPYGLEIQSPLHRADLSPVLHPPPVVQWLFPTDLQGWTRYEGEISWENLGFPVPGCLHLGGRAPTCAQSPFFDSTGALSITCSLYRKYEWSTYSTFQIWVWKAPSWYILYSVYEQNPNWRFTSIPIAPMWASPNMRVAVRKAGLYHTLVDTVTVSMTF